MTTYIIGGLGIIGSALHRVLSDSVVIDTAAPETLVQYGNMRPEDVAFLCLPTPYDPFARSYDYSAVREAVDRIPSGVLTVLRSTVTPDVFSPRMFKAPWLYHPEFLRAAHADMDIVSAKVHVYGAIAGAKKHIDTVERLYHEAGIHVRPIVLTPQQASWTKLAHNVYCATNIALANEMACWVKRAIGGDWDMLRCALADVLDDGEKSWRTTSTVPGPDGRYGFGGACYPKDVAASREAMVRAGAVRDVVEGVLTSNARVRVVG